LFINQRIELKFVSNQEREIRLFVFVFRISKEMKLERVKIRLNFPYKFVNAKRGAQPQDNIKTERKRDRVQSINQNKTRSISARVKLDKCSID